MGHNRRLKPICAACGDPYSPKRANAGYHLCMPCGEGQSIKQRESWCILTPHKQGAMFFTAESARDLARGINSKYVPVN